MSAELETILNESNLPNWVQVLRENGHIDIIMSCSKTTHITMVLYLLTFIGIDVLIYIYMQNYYQNSADSLNASDASMITAAICISLVFSIIFILIIWARAAKKRLSA